MEGIMLTCLQRKRSRVNQFGLQELEATGTPEGEKIRGES